MPGTVVSHYRILNPLGSGGMGVVYRAEDTTLGRTVALKFLPASAQMDVKGRARLREEARTASALNHPNICTIYEVGESPEELYIAMEYVEGKPLSEMIPSRGMPVATAMRYARQIASALEHAHARGVVHRDLKPLNIVITPHGEAKVLDFGLARRTDPAEFDRKTLETVTTQEDGDPLEGTTAGVPGTIPYMAPEQLEGEDASPRTDLWALGVVLYEMLSGQRPFRGGNLYRMCTAILRDPPPALPPHVPAGLAAIVHRCLEKEPGRRYQRAGELRAALEAISEESQPRFGAGPWTRHIRLGLLGLGAVLIAAVLGVTNWNLRRGIDPRAQGPTQLAILPPQSGGGDQERAFDGGLVETLTTRLGRLSSGTPLVIIPASEIRTRKVATLEEARSEFGAHLVLQLTVQRMANQVRVNFSLVDAQTRRLLGGDTVTAGVDDPFGLQDSVSDGVMKLLAMRAGPQEQQTLQERGTLQPAAYDFYLQGRGYLREIGRLENVENAVAVFQRAIEKDPKYAAAQAGLGEAYWRKYELVHDTALVAKAEEECRGAAARDAGLAVAHTCLGLVFNGRGKYEQAAEEYQRALGTDAKLDDAHAGLALAYQRLGRIGDAEKAYREAIRLQPNYWVGYNRLGHLYRAQGRAEDAERMYEQVVALAPDSFIGYSNLGMVRMETGRYAEAIPFFERSLKIRRTAQATSNLATAYFQTQRYADAAQLYEEAIHLGPQESLLWGNLGDAYYWAPGLKGRAAEAYGKAIALAEKERKVNPRDASRLAMLAWYHAMLGEREQSRSLMTEALRIDGGSGDVLYCAAIVYAQAGETSRALAALERAVAAGYSPATIRDTPNFQGLKGNPRFDGLLSIESGKKGKKQ